MPFASFAAAVDALMPNASEDERCAATAHRLYQDASAQPWIREAEWEWGRARQATAAQGRAEAAVAQPSVDVAAGG
ncbi:hypothetical protein ACFWIA_27835 [Streptomyces sp. NPDC127068]|uniref:hypothetical protein n=1 Tax=Streptomyces sp. NPDC127068 TaxID=3347127 RepID=UPI003661A7CD